VHGPIITCHSIRLSEVKTELAQSQMAREQDATALNQAQDAQCKSEAISQKVIEDIAKLGRAMSTGYGRARHVAWTDDA
jgi:uncharacterized protein YqfA (UPF0365 family)